MAGQGVRGTGEGTFRWQAVRRCPGCVFVNMFSHQLDKIRKAVHQSSRNGGGVGNRLDKPSLIPKTWEGEGTELRFAGLWTESPVGPKRAAQEWMESADTEPELGGGSLL